MIQKTIWIIITCIILLSCHSKESQYDASGTFEATEIIVSSQVTGNLLKFDIHEGMTLKKGEYIGCIDTTQLYIQKKQIMYNIASAKARIPDVQIQTASLYQQLNNDLVGQKRIQNLYQDSAATKQQLDNINTQVTTIQKQIEAQQNTLSQTKNSILADIQRLQIQVQQINDMLYKSYVYNPISGIILAKYKEAYEFVTPGTQLYKIADITQMYLRAFITGDQIKDIRLAQKVKVRTDYGNNDFKTFDGTITWISDKAEFTPKNIQTKNQRANLVYAIKILINNNDSFIKIGQYGDVSFR